MSGDPNRCPFCGKHFPSGKKGVLDHVGNVQNKECHSKFYRTRPPSPTRDRRSSSPSSNSSRSSRVSLTSGDDEPPALFPDAPESDHAQGDFLEDSDDSSSMSLDDLQPPPPHAKAEPHVLNCHRVKHQWGGKSFGPANTVLDDIRFNDKFWEERESILYFPFASELEWELAAWISKADMSKEHQDAFFRLQFVRISYVKWIMVQSSWPYSRSNFPKQFSPSILQATCRDVSNSFPSLLPGNAES